MNHVVNLYVPAIALDVARCINRSLDADDIGGAGAFSTKCIADVQGESLELYRYSRPCTAEYAKRISMLVQCPEELFALCAVDYAQRWPELEHPTFKECALFCASVLCYVDSDIEFILEEAGTI